MSIEERVETEVERDIRVIDTNLNRMYNRLETSGLMKEIEEVKELIETYKGYRKSLIETPYDVFVINGKGDFHYVNGSVRKEVLPDNWERPEGME